MLKLSSAAVELIKNSKGCLWKHTVMSTVLRLLGMVTLFSNGRSSMVLLPLLKQSAC